jgi:formate dehydrogenase iron-sulfur subunit
VACKQWNEKDGEKTEMEDQLGFQNPATLSAKTLTLIAFHEVENRPEPGGVEVSLRHAAVPPLPGAGLRLACPTTALYRQADGPVSYNVDDCIGCRYLHAGVPWDVPTAEWNSHAPKISKCTHCADRAVSRRRSRSTGRRCPTSGQAVQRHHRSPACVKACPADALRYGTREEMLALAHKRIADRPDKYVDHVYGEKELGGTSVLYLSRVPFEKLGFPTYGEKPFPAFTKTALGAVPPAVMAVGALLGAAYAFFRKRVQAVADGSAAAKHSETTATSNSSRSRTSC